MLELKKKHKRGKRTFIYTFVSYGWWLTLIGIVLLYLAGSIYFGSLNESATQFLAQHPDWYINTSMLSQWLFLLGLSFLLVAYLRARVMYAKYKFILDPHAFHIHRGIFFIREITIPYQQISNVHINRPYHYRMFGIAQLDIVTSADRGEEDDDGKNFLLPVIDTSVARMLSRQLLESASRYQNGVRGMRTKSPHEKDRNKIVDEDEDEDFDGEDFEDDDE